MKAVLVSQRLVTGPESGEIRETLDVEWGAFLSQCGLIPIPVSLKARTSTYFETFRPAGVLLTGGNDLAICNPQDPLNAERDGLESLLSQQGIERNLPLLGVCRGMQMICHHFGSRLEARKGHINQHHAIEIQKNSALESFYGNYSEVNSYHQFCVTRLEDGLRELARAGNDQTIEAIQHEKFKIIGVMWHPERVKPFSLADVNFFSSFFSTK